MQVDYNFSEQIDGAMREALRAKVPARVPRDVAGELGADAAAEDGSWASEPAASADSGEGRAPRKTNSVYARPRNGAVQSGAAPPQAECAVGGVRLSPLGSAVSPRGGAPSPVRPASCGDGATPDGASAEQENGLTEHGPRNGAVSVQGACVEGDGKGGCGKVVLRGEVPASLEEQPQEHVIGAGAGVTA